MGRKTIVVCGATSSGSISGRHKKIEPATPNLGETHYGERSGFNPVSIFIEPLHYPIGLKITDAELTGLNLKLAKFHGDWNYTLLPPK